MAHIAGYYTMTWNTTSIGETKTGFTLREVQHVQQILTDQGGDAPVDGIQAGVEVFIDLDFVEYDLLKAPIYGALTQGLPFAKVGTLLSTLAKGLVLTATVTGQDIYTFTKTVIEGDIATLLSTKLREGPLTFRAYPDSGNSDKTYVVTTAP